MSSKFKRTTTAVALLLLFATSQVYVGVSFAGPGSVVRAANAAMMPQNTGILKTQSNKVITVNGADAISGATILSGATINTPAGVGATVNLGGLGWLDIAPQAILTLTFETGRVRVLLSQGCVVLHTKKNTTGQIETAEGVIAKSDPTKDDVLRVCSERGAVPPSNIGANAGAGTGSATAGAGGGISTATKVLIGALAGGGAIAAAIIVPCRRGANPSPGEPRGVNDECR